MGQEITRTHFRMQDFHRFERRIASEMALLHEHFRLERFSTAPLRIGLELETWLVDERGQPQPKNQEFLEHVAELDVVPELAQFNVEFNVAHQQLSGTGLHKLESELTETWNLSREAAAGMGLDLAAIGILPTIQSHQLSVKTMSVMSRYRALNEQVLRLRRGRPIALKIDGHESLNMQHDDVMLEAAATSLQVHYQVPLADSVRYFNAAMIASPAVTAISANSPYLFGKQLWAETRIPLFEQAVDIGGPFPRVYFGSGYVNESLEELFLENRVCQPALLPMEMSDPVELLPHVRLHNGTIWRWNRPLIGFDDSGQPHLRVEHRVMAAGPTMIDMMANIAFATGLIHSLATAATPPESQLPFETCFANFTNAAKHGLHASQTWLDGSTAPVGETLLEELLPMARAGLELLKIAPMDIDRYLNVIQQRAESGWNGAEWQVQWIRKHGLDMAALTQAYLTRQQSGVPVHEWTL